MTLLNSLFIIFLILLSCHWSHSDTTSPLPHQPNILQKVSPSLDLENVRKKFLSGNTTKNAGTHHADDDDDDELNSVYCDYNRNQYDGYSSSFHKNSTEQELHFDRKIMKTRGPRFKPIREKNVNARESITLCWIEITTVEEHKNVDPPKRVILREYMISIENFATIPIEYVDCKKREEKSDSKNKNEQRRSSSDYIDHDTKVSKIVNFTSTNDKGSSIISEHKKVKCAVGPVLTNSLAQWYDDYMQQRKRIEIKVGPKLKPVFEFQEEDDDSDSVYDEYYEY